MHRPFGVFIVVAAFAQSACDSGGISTREMERAAMERARQELKLAAHTPLEATVWTGKPVDGDVAFCGTVSSPDGSASPIMPQRFLATGDPLKFEVFEPAHEPFARSRPDMFLSWVEYCPGHQPA